MRFYHGNADTFVAHAGLCLTSSRHAARSYARGAGAGATIHTVDVDLAGLVCRELVLTQAHFDLGEYPGDRESEIAEFVAQGVDYLKFNDIDFEGQAHDTVRLISERALSAVRLVESQPAGE